MDKLMPTALEATEIQALNRALWSVGDCAVAVSGGVDSMTLAVVAHRWRGDQDVVMYHAVSAAVPPEATQRVRAYAEREGWQLEVIDAGEIGDPRYVANPANRCYFCKTNLYGTMAALTGRQLLSGTNTDDLGDYRPGLNAAREHEVRHPYVEAGIDKAGVRAIARALQLDDLAELPAAPCLSSRVETGIQIDPGALRSINDAENLLRRALQPQTVRCRVRAQGVVIELDAPTLQRLDDQRRDALATQISALFTDAPTVSFANYSRGSAFLVETLAAPPGVSATLPDSARHG